MISRTTLIPALLIVLTCIMHSGTLSRAADPQTPLQNDMPGGAERYLAYLSTDKPIYREQEFVYLRTVVLNASDNTPLEAGRHSIKVKIIGPQGDVVHEGLSHGMDSAIGYRWKVPEGIAGGQYTAKVTIPTLGVPETERMFDIRVFRAPRIKTQIHFTRDAYGPGDQVKASAAMERAEGGVPQNASVTAISRLDGKEIYRSAAVKLTDKGIINTAFRLPANISAGAGSLTFVIEDGGVIETASKSLPIVLQSLDISFYPESGELVAGLQSRVYFQALLSNGKPADVQGYIVEIVGNTPNTTSIAEFSSDHEGRGLFVFTPEKSKQYAAVLTAPSGIVHPAKLPIVKNTGTVIRSQRATFTYDEHIEFSIASNAASHPARMTLHKRKVQLDSQDISSNTIQLDAKDAEGVLIATAWDSSGNPLAERLIYRHPRFGLNIELILSDGPYLPGSKVSVDVLTTDDQDKPVEAIVGLSITDDTVLELVEKRQQAPRLPTMVYLENDVLDLADAHVYLDSSDPNAGSAIDLLLGTQGWRRFVLVSYPDIKKQYPSQIARAMAENSQALPPPMMMQRAAIAEEMQLAMMMEAEEMVVAEAVDMAKQAAPAAIPIQKKIQQIIPMDENLIEADAERVRVANAEQRLEMADMGIAADAIMARPANSAYVREFAFQTRANRLPNERIDFTETLYWNSGVKTGARDGRATIEFSLSDGITTFRLLADGYGRNGALGTGEAVIKSVEPFFITTKMPLHATVGDIVELPVTMVNTSDRVIDNASLSVNGEGISSQETDPISLAPGQRLRSIINVTTTKPGTFPITVNALAGPHTDTVTRGLTVSAAGFPVSFNAGGLLSSSTPFTSTVDIPQDISVGSLTATAKVYPSPLASMEEALNALLREPHGCFEQTSSTNYPLIMAQQYFDSHTGIDPEKISRSQGLLITGYGKLISFESADSGYEWFGANPAHEALTAYGLMQFTDMAKVMQVDGTMIERTRQWLLERRDGKGGFLRNERALDSFGRASAPTTDAYIVWALLESGQSPMSLKTEISQIKDQAFNGDDSYITALAANILYLSGDTASAELLLEKLAAAVNNSGAVQGATASITGSGGDALTIETTSLALLAWLRNDEQWAAQVEMSMKWLFERSKAGRFGSTQSTVLAIKAINTYDAARAVPKQPGAVQLFINDKAISEPVTFNTDSKGAIELPEFSSLMVPGQHKLELRMIDGSKMPFALDIGYNTPLPANANIRPVRLTTALSHTTLVEGEPLELQASISTGTSNVPTPIAIIGIPAGLELRYEQLKELVGDGSISAFEVRQSELVLYWRALKANETRVIPIGLTAEIPGNYTASASRIYPYYTDEQKHWHAGHSVEVVAR